MGNLKHQTLYSNGIKINSIFKRWYNIINIDIMNDCNGYNIVG